MAELAEDYALLAAWRAAIAATDATLAAFRATRCPETVANLGHAQDEERAAGRRYLAARDRAVAAQVTCSAQGPGVADFEGGVVERAD